MSTLLEVKGLETRFYTQEGIVKAVNGISYDLDEGETLGIVSERGHGLPSAHLWTACGHTRQSVSTSIDGLAADVKDRLSVTATYLDSRVVVLPGQQQIAMDRDRDLFVGEALRFLREQWNL